jgi:hypothetical protein
VSVLVRFCSFTFDFERGQYYLPGFKVSILEGLIDYLEAPAISGRSQVAAQVPGELKFAVKGVRFGSVFVRLPLTLKEGKISSY